MFKVLSHRRLLGAATSLALAVSGLVAVNTVASAAPQYTGSVSRTGPHQMTYTVKNVGDARCYGEHIPVRVPLTSANHVRTEIPISDGADRHTEDNIPDGSYFTTITCIGNNTWVPDGTITNIGSVPPPSGTPQAAGSVSNVDGQALAFEVTQVQPGANCVERYMIIREYFNSQNFGSATLPLVAGVGASTSPALPPGRYVGMISCTLDGSTRYPAITTLFLRGSNSSGSVSGSSSLFPLGNARWIHRPADPVF